MRPHREDSERLEDIHYIAALREDAIWFIKRNWFILRVRGRSLSVVQAL